MPPDRTFVLPCVSCGAAPLNDDARFCRRCGSTLPLEHVNYLREPQTITGWKSIPGPIRFAIWMVALPVLIGFAIWAMMLLGVLAVATR
jgi:hypothetical protein